MSSETTAAATKTTTNTNTTTTTGSLDLVVKSKYILSERPSCLAAPPPVEERTKPSDANHDNRDNNNESKRSKKNKGQNKKRPRDNRIAFGDKVCLAIVRGQPCPFLNTPKGCRYNHNLKEILANRPIDISDGENGAAWLKGGCPFWNAKGFCDFGVMCRLGSCHVNMSTGQNLCRVIESEKDTSVVDTSKEEDVTEDKVVDESKVDEVGAKVKEDKVKDEDKANVEDKVKNEIKADEDGAKVDEGGIKNEEDKVKDAATKSTPAAGTMLGHHAEIMNVLSKDTQVKLRKNKYPFVCKRHFEVQKGGGQKAPPKIETSSTPAVIPSKRKLIDFRNKVYIAPLTTVGNLPFRRIMKHYGADITCGEMALADQLLGGKPSEWALLKRHPSEDVFGVQIAAGHADQYTRVAEVLANEPSMDIDFVDLNLGCPIDMVCQKGAGASLMLREKKLKASLEGMLKVLPCPVTIKMRTGWKEDQPIAHEFQPKIQSWQIDGVGAFMIHGRSRLQRYSRLANWDYISQVACSQSPDYPQIPMIGNGDIFSYSDYEEKILNQISSGDEGEDGKKNNLIPCAMLGRGALIKPWLPTEIKEKRNWDISASERLDMLKDFVKFGLEHWGTDQQGVNHTRRFLLEWISFLYRYVPVGLLEVLPQQMNQRPPLHMCGRSDLETLMMSKNCADWIKISEILLGPVPEGFQFEPKHKANSFAKK